jgi:hypothetical protein
MGSCLYDKYVVFCGEEDLAMTTKTELEHRLEELRLEYRKVYSMLSMMEKGTSERDLAKMRKEQLDPIKREIARLEGELSLLK